MAESVIKDEIDLYIVDQNIKQREARYRTKTGEIERIARGIYVRKGADVGSVVARNAARIAQTLFPDSVIAYSSAASLGLVENSQGLQNGVMYLSGPGRQYKVELPGMTIVRAKASDSPSIGKVQIKDQLGSYEIGISNPAQIILENFKTPAGYPEAGLPMDMFTYLVRLNYEWGQWGEWEDMEAYLAKLGEPQLGVDQTRLALRYVSDVRASLEAENYFDEDHGLFDDQEELIGGKIDLSDMDSAVWIHWYDKKIGQLNYDYASDSFAFEPDSGWLVPLSDSGNNAKGLPYFIESNMPEGWLEYVFKGVAPSGILKDRRFMANLSAHDENSPTHFRPPVDMLDGLLDIYVEDGTFNGLVGNLPQDDAFFSEELSRMWLDGQDALPLLSGAQVKVPMNLSSWGNLSPASNRPFTHILKVPGSHYELECMCVIEWVGMEMARAAGLDTPEFCMVKPYPHKPPFLLVERFDIISKGDKAALFAEDMGSALGLNSHMKARTSIEEIYEKVILKQSTDPEGDARVLFRQAMAAFLIGNGDMHAKNISMLKRANEDMTGFESVTLSPVYDFSCSQVFASVSHDAQALSVNGKKQGLTLTDYFSLAEKLSISEFDAKGIIIDAASSIADRAATLRRTMPAIIEDDDISMATVERALVIAEGQCDKALRHISDMEGPAFAVSSRRNRAVNGR